MPGLIGKKIGMTSVFTEEGKNIPCTILETGPCVVTQVKTLQRHGYQAVQVGYEESRKINQPEKGHLKRTSPFRHLKEFRVDSLGDFQIGQRIDADIFQPGDIIDVVGVSTGRGFAGAMKRHNFSGGPKTHGQSDRHRAPGSIGGTTYPGRVSKGQRMPGHWGAERVTVKKVEVVQTDLDRNVLFVKGAVPGARDGLIIMRKGTSKES